MEYEKYNKKIGKEVVSRASEIDDIEWFSTGIEPLDYVIGKGLPKGRMVSFKGLSSVTKTSLALAVIASAQKQGIPCVFVDAELALSLHPAKMLGVDLEELIVIRPDTAEEALDALEEMITEEMLVVVDSVAALSAKAEMEADMGSQGMALQARIVTRALRKLSPLVSRTNSTIIWINQLRMNITGGQYSPYTETGGMALKFFTSVALEIKKKGDLKSSDKVVGIAVAIKAVKNKVGIPSRECKLDFLFDSGFHGESNWFEIGVDKGLITMEGRTYYFKDQKLDIGQQKAKQALTKEMVEEIKDHQ